MQELKKADMQLIYGGSIPSQLINALAKFIETIYELGESTGSSIRRLILSEYCPTN